MRAPATRDQADAYRFGLRRLEAALVRGDPVPLHEGIRTQRRATLAGIVLGLLGLCAAAVYAVVVPRPDWRSQAVVIAERSGALYAVAHRPDRLVPVPDLVAGRLVLAALRAAGHGDADPGGAVPVVVPDDALAGAARAPAAGVPGAVATDPGATVAGRWAVCDEVGPDGRLRTTTVLGGTAPLPAVAPSDGVLLVDPGGGSWLVVAGRRHRLDARDGRLLAAYGLVRVAPRAVSGPLLAVLPTGPELRTPVVPQRGGAAPRGLPGRVGDVLVARPVGGAPRHFVVLADGVQEVSELVGGLLRAASGARAALPVGLEAVAAAAVLDELPVAGWPDRAPRLRAPGPDPVLCWAWTADGSGAGAVWVGAGAPGGARGAPVPAAGADGPGPALDAVAVGGGGAVRAEPGGTWLLSSTGVGYPVADEPTAAALGIGGVERAPAAVLELLPRGPLLDVRAAGRALGLPARPG